jgi:uncharacterized repeat protein (TIGR01451 family)
VAGLVGLLIAADPSLAGNVDMLENVITTTAVPRTTTQICGGIPGSEIPNNTYGYGRIDALAAVQHVQQHTLAISKSTSAVYVAPGELLTYTLTITHSHYLTPTNNVVVTDTIPAGTTFITATLPHSFDGSVVEWEIASLDSNTSWTADLVVQVNEEASGTITNDEYGTVSEEAAAVSGSPVSTPIYVYVLGLSKVASAEEVAAGELLTYTITVTNLHPLGQATGVELSDVIPTGTTFVTATLPHTFDGTTVTWTAGTLPSGSNWSVTLVVQVDEQTFGNVSNSTYAAISDQAPEVNGPPVTTIVTNDNSAQLYLPVVINH